MNTTVRTGLELLVTEGLPELAGRQVGLITNHTGVDSRLRSGPDLLLESKNVVLAALFGPEHGVRGEAQAGVEVGAATDRRTCLPVWSLYGSGYRPTSEMLAGLDALLFDIQDIGVRYATYISTMFHAQAATAEAGLDFVVLDRPNPLGGVQVAGNLLDPAFGSFVGIAPIPILHGMTVGELARLFAAEQHWPTPHVIPMRGWRREQWYDDTGLPWVLPTPNLPTLDSLTVYAGTCLIEGTNLSEGRGTTRPFEYVGAPWIDPFRLAEDLDARGLAGLLFRPAYFTPSFGKHVGVTCGGVQVHITTRTAVRATELGIHLLHALRSQDPDAFAWHQNGESRPFVDLLLGSDKPRRALQDGAEPGDILAPWQAEAAAFAERRRPYLLYEH